MHLPASFVGVRLVHWLLAGARRPVSEYGGHLSIVALVLLLLLIVVLPPLPPIPPAGVHLCLQLPWYVRLSACCHFLRYCPSDCDESPALTLPVEF